MKPFFVLVALQAAFLVVSSTQTVDLGAVSSLGEIINDLTGQIQFGGPDAVANDRTGRILALYSQETAQNTFAALGKLDEVSRGVVGVSGEVVDLNTSLNVSNTQIIQKLNGIDAALKTGSDIVTDLDRVGTTLDAILAALSDSSNPATLPGQVKKLYDLLDNKFEEIEKIIGYENYPPAPEV